MTQTRIGLLLFPRMTQLDLTGPFEVFAKLPDAEVLLLWKTLQPVEEPRPVFACFPTPRCATAGMLDLRAPAAPASTT